VLKRGIFLSIAVALGLAAASLAGGLLGAARADQSEQNDSVKTSQAAANAETNFLDAARLNEKNSAHGENEPAKASAERNKSAPVIVIGFVGGFVRKGNSVHNPVKIAASLRSAYPEGVHVEVFENHHREEAYRKVLQLLDESHDGQLREEAKQAARIIIYGMSWGGSETVSLARELAQQQIPVLLTIQVDSVRKLGENDGTIPANVSEAVNFYQDDGLLHGRAQIRAEDATRTRIVGNFRYGYKANPLACEEYPWWDRWLTKYHTNIECDPAVWNRVEGLIREKLPPPIEK